MRLVLIERVKNMLKNKKPYSWVLSIAAVVVILASVYLMTNSIETLELPDDSLVVSMEIEQFNDRTSVGNTVVTDKNDINFVLNGISGARKTLQRSLNDYPTQSDYIVVRLNLEGEMRTLCLYTEGNEYYLEEPYIGVYRYNGDQAFIKAVYNKYEPNLVVDNFNDLKSIEIFIWKDGNQTNYSVFEGIKEGRMESEIYEGNMVFSDIDEVNNVLAKYQVNGLHVSIRQMNIIDFTKDEMQTIADRLKIPVENYSISIGVYIPPIA